MTLLIRDLASGYGTGLVLDGIDLDLARGEVLAVMGRNGMGKTTLLRTLMGQCTIARGTIELDNRRLDGLSSHEVARTGLGYVPQGRAIFNDLRVLENLRLGRFVRNSTFEWQNPALAAFPVLTDRVTQRAGTLSGGEQQQLAIARALEGRPHFLLLDEPSEGIQPSIVAEIAALLRRLADEHEMGVLLVEQQLDLALKTADRLLVLEKGRIKERFDRLDHKTASANLAAAIGI